MFQKGNCGNDVGGRKEKLHGLNRYYKFLMAIMKTFEYQKIMFTSWFRINIINILGYCHQLICFH